MNKLCLVVGHSEQSQGAVNEASGVTEWGFNKELVDEIFGKILDFDDREYDAGKYDFFINPTIFHRTAGIPDLVNRINEWNPDLAIEFHLNAWDEMIDCPECGGAGWFDGNITDVEPIECARCSGTGKIATGKKASGAEMLLSNIYDKNPMSLLGESGIKFVSSVRMLSNQVSNYIGIKDRGIKFSDINGRGGYFLNKTKCRAIIAESFFLDNDSDLQKANENRPALIKAYVDWIINYFREG
jgi:hypothetical protein